MIIQEKVYVDQPPRFLNSFLPNHVFKLKKNLYDLKLAHKTGWVRTIHLDFDLSGFNQIYSTIIN